MRSSRNASWRQISLSPDLWDDSDARKSSMGNSQMEVDLWRKHHCVWPSRRPRMICITGAAHFVLPIIQEAMPVTWGLAQLDKLPLQEPSTWRVFQHLKSPFELSCSWINRLYFTEWFDAGVFRVLLGWDVKNNVLRFSLPNRSWTAAALPCPAFQSTSLPPSATMFFSRQVRHKMIRLIDKWIFGLPVMSGFWLIGGCLLSAPLQQCSGLSAFLD